MRQAGHQCTDQIWDMRRSEQGLDVPVYAKCAEGSGHCHNVEMKVTLMDAAQAEIPSRLVLEIETRRNCKVRHHY